MNGTAIQFKAAVENGVIPIPEAYRGMIDSPVMVSIWTEDTKSRKIRPRSKRKPFTLDDFSAMKLDTRGWQFNREQAHER